MRHFLVNQLFFESDKADGDEAAAGACCALVETSGLREISEKHPRGLCVKGVILITIEPLYAHLPTNSKIYIFLKFIRTHLLVLILKAARKMFFN